MKKTLFLVCLLVSICLINVSCKPRQSTFAKPPASIPTGKPTFQNPILDQDFPDPTAIMGGDGWYYAYATQSISKGDTFNIQLARSKDLVQWEYLGDAMPQKPAWASHTQKFWAPHVLHDSITKKYYMYFSGRPNGKDGLCLGVAVAHAPQGPFIAEKEPFQCGEGFVNIDPVAFDDPKSGKHLLYWGSGFKPIKVQELSADRLHFAPGSSPKDVVSPGKDKDYSILIEGGWVSYRNGKYYLFYSGDNCCGDKAHYAVMVARADDPFGPFERLGEANGTGNSVILEQKTHWRAPGHNSIVTDRAGNDWIVYHAIAPKNPTLGGDSIKGDRHDRRIMLMDPIVYKNDWPEVAGGEPSIGAISRPVVK